MLSDAQFRDLVSGSWKGPVAGALRGALSALECPYGWIVGRRNARFDRCVVQPTKVPAPVISVGNITVGGTGKSPFVAWLARWYLDRDTPVTIISRGYGTRAGQPNDEALELAARLPGVPHLQNPDRISAAEEALQSNPRQVLILDDAFQHRRLARDLDIVLLDALTPFGYGRLLPRGLLREPINNLARAHVIALSRSDAVDAGRRREIEATAGKHAPQAIWIELAHRPQQLVSAGGETMDVAALRGQSVAAFCGIGNPAGFRHTLETCGLNVNGWLELADHCPYADREMAQIHHWLAPLDAIHVICTRKDLVKIPHHELAGKKLWALNVKTEVVRGSEKLEAALKKIEAQL